MDDIDRSQEDIEWFRSIYINAHVNRLIQSQSATHCKVCGDAILPARQKSIPGVNTCTECQAYIEQQQHCWRK